MKENEIKYFKNFGFNCFGPILKEFCLWLIDELKKQNIKKVYFLARDGAMMKKVFDYINDTEIKSYYLYASRRAIIVPALHKIENVEEIFNMITFSNDIKLKYFIKMVGLENIELKEYLEKYSFNLEMNINTQNIKENKKFMHFLNDIFEIIKENSKNENLCMKKYLKKMDFQGKVAIVDIGWHGTMQMAMRKSIENVEIYGYYMGIKPFINSSELNMKSFLFEDKKNSYLYEKFKYFIGIFEYLFLAQEGSTKKYNNSKNGYCLYSYEYEGRNEKEIAENIQNGAIEYVKHKEQKNINENCYDNLLKTMLKPTCKDAKFWGNLIFLDQDERPFAKPKSILYYFLNLKKLKNDFIESSWRIGFLKRLLIIPLPYYKINEMLRKIFLKKGIEKDA